MYACVNSLYGCNADSTGVPVWQLQFYDRVRAPRGIEKYRIADNLYPGVLNLALQWILLEIRMIGYFRSHDGRKNIRWVLRIVQLALGKHDERISAIVALFICFILLMIRLRSLRFQKKRHVHYVRARTVTRDRTFLLFPITISLTVVYCFNDIFYFLTVCSITR